MDSNPLYLTGNTDTVYCMVFLDLQADGPTVLEIPPGMGPGTVDDAFFRFVIDLGAPGPDAGKGGKYLILPPDYKGAVPKDKKDGGEYYVAKSTSYVNWVPLRGFLVDGKPDAAVKMFKEGFKVYPLSKAANPPKMEFISGSKLPINTVHANDIEFYHELDHVIQKEPIGFLDPELRGLAASIGIVKGKKFAPDERMKKILTDAVAVGNATARAISFRDRDRRVDIYPNSQWQSLSLATDYQWLDKDAEGARNLDARTKFFYALHRQHAQDDGQDRGRWLAVRRRLRRLHRRSVRRLQELQDQRPGERPRQQILVGGALRPADALAAADQPAVPQQEQHARQADRQRGRVGGHLLRAQGARRQGSQLDCDRPRQGSLRRLPALRPAGAVVRPKLAAR